MTKNQTPEEILNVIDASILPASLLFTGIVARSDAAADEILFRASPEVNWIAIPLDMINRVDQSKCCDSKWVLDLAEPTADDARVYAEVFRAGLLKLQMDGEMDPSHYTCECSTFLRSMDTGAVASGSGHGGAPSRSSALRLAKARAVNDAAKKLKCRPRRCEYWSSDPDERFDCSCDSVHMPEPDWFVRLTPEEIASLAEAGELMPTLVAWGVVARGSRSVGALSMSTSRDSQPVDIPMAMIRDVFVGLRGSRWNELVGVVFSPPGSKEGRVFFELMYQASLS